MKHEEKVCKGTQKTPETESKSPVIKFCESCVGNAACVECNLLIVSNSRVVKPITINGITANWFFCKRSCWKAFRAKHLTKSKKKKEARGKKAQDG